MVRRNDCHGVNNETANQSTFSCASGVERKRSSFAVALFLAGPAGGGDPRYGAAGTSHPCSSHVPPLSMSTFCRLASLVGENVAFTILEAISEVSPDALRRSLADLRVETSQRLLDVVHD